ncbi:N,N-dimethylformamidase beta subunit family domain-containing protein [Streptacidiphilus melanogenes]|uniref:N,N-dimethylformamidase beta subunit family domain-containing protein n=1 Tax=Streptacidiphilus melanogenes TaxID=411235 RepID=UPI00126A5A5B|nr:N,N-dimethylformamidase beta subunit family domain-containing protein [Streptacidiphilus melanogenes]
MREVTRRGLLRGVGRAAAATAGVAAGAAGLASLAGCAGDSDDGGGGPATARPADVRTGNPIIRENGEAGSRAWVSNDRGAKPVTDDLSQIKAFADTTSVAHGERITFHVATAEPQSYSVAIFRMGHYGGAGGRLLTTGPTQRGNRQSAPQVDGPTATVRTEWEPGWSLEIPQDWVSGLYLASFTTEHGERTAVPFAVRDDSRASTFLVVLPFNTYQAYNQYPFDGVLGRSLYYGFLPSAADPAARAKAPDGRAYPAEPVPHEQYVRHYPQRSRAVSFQRPYQHDGMPAEFALDLAFVSWAEREGMDVTYATNLDLHEGRVAPTRHQALLFSGHDEYWSAQIRQTVEQAVAGGLSLATFAANDCYWKVRIDRDPSGYPLMTCYKTDPDPVHDPTGPSTFWRRAAPNSTRAEQRLLGGQYTGAVVGSSPLVVTESAHWFWQGTGLIDGDLVPDLISGEADGRQKGVALPAARQYLLLSDSQFRAAGRNRPQQQNTTLYRSTAGGWVFNAGTFGWALALGGGAALEKPQVQLATRNLVTRLKA